MKGKLFCKHDYYAQGWHWSTDPIDTWKHGQDGYLYVRCKCVKCGKVKYKKLRGLEADIFLECMRINQEG